MKGIRTHQENQKRERGKHEKSGAHFVLSKYLAFVLRSHEYTCVDLKGFFVSCLRGCGCKPSQTHLYRRRKADCRVVKT